jgi:hypothetical protein
MIEFVFNPSRLIAGKRVVSRLFSGRYAVEKGREPGHGTAQHARPGNRPETASGPFALFREGTTKDKDKCAVPLKAELADQLRVLRPADCLATDRALKGHLANYDLFRKHLKRAGIAHKDALGSVLHLHSFRKTWQTLGVRYGVNQRAAQEVLGHSDANLTAKAYERGRQ